MGKSSGKSKTVVEQQPLQYGPWTENILKSLYGTATNQLKNPLHPLMSEGLADQTAMARQGGQLLPGATDTLGAIQSGQMVNPAFQATRRLAMGDEIGTNPWLEATYERASRPLLQNLTETVNPGIDISAASAGRTGGGMHALLRNRAGEQTGQALTDLSTNIYGGAYESDQGRRMAALGQLGQLGQQDVGNRMAAAGAAPGFDAARFADAERLYALGQQYQDAPYAVGRNYASVAGALPYSGGGQTTTGREPGTPLGSELFAGALGLGNLGILGYGVSQFGPSALMLSDERAKTDIEPAGITFGGTPLYRYRYKGRPETQIGVLAQEVALTQPEAVGVMPDGLLGVDYGLVR